jgi:hypothetical protein
MGNTDFFLLADVARILRCRPALRIGNKRVFTPPDIRRIAERLHVQLAGEAP